MSGPDFYVYFTQHGVGAFQNEVFPTWRMSNDWGSATGVGRPSRTIYSALENQQVEMRAKREDQHCRLKGNEDENAKKGKYLKRGRYIQKSIQKSAYIDTVSWVCALG
jgi:hypothetical protein